MILLHNDWEFILLLKSDIGLMIFFIDIVVTDVKLTELSAISYKHALIVKKVSYK